MVILLVLVEVEEVIHCLHIIEVIHILVSRDWRDHGVPLVLHVGMEDVDRGAFLVVFY